MEVVRRSIYRCADFEIDPGLAAIRRGDEVLHLRPKTFQVLLYLLENRHRLVEDANAGYNVHIARTLSQ